MGYQMTLDNELIVDNFAGGGGASLGIEMPRFVMNVYVIGNVKGLFVLRRIQPVMKQ